MGSESIWAVADELTVGEDGRDQKVRLKRPQDVGTPLLCYPA